MNERLEVEMSKDVVKKAKAEEHEGERVKCPLLPERNGHATRSGGARGG